jgi:hypothetical protein
MQGLRLTKRWVSYGALQAEAHTLHLRHLVQGHVSTVECCCILQDLARADITRSVAIFIMCNQHASDLVVGALPPYLPAGSGSPVGSASSMRLTFACYLLLSRLRTPRH